jgi:hypothetical protein
MNDREYMDTPTWFTNLYPENLDPEFCAEYLRVSKYHIDLTDLNSKENPCTVAEQYSCLAWRLAKLWYGAAEKKTRINDDFYKDRTDDFWVYSMADEFFGSMPDQIYQKLNSYLKMQKHELDLVIPESERWNWDKICDRYHKWSDATVETIIEFINQHSFETIHYVGNVDEGITKAIRKNEYYKLTIMDMLNKFESGYGYHFDDNLNFVDFGRPPWLERIPFYSEGGPVIPDLWIRDCGWNWEKQFDDILTFAMPRRPTHVILLGDAINHGLHEFYSWREQQDVYFGELKEEHALQYTNAQRAQLNKQDAHMRGERE